MFSFSVAHAIPAVIMQTYAYLGSEGKSSAIPFISIAASIFTVAYCTVIIGFDYDLEPARRAYAPRFYGYIPSSAKGRLTVFLSMFVFSSCHIIMKVLGIALFARVEVSYVYIYLGGDMLLYFLWKGFRSDLRYWLRLDGAISWVGSFVVRFMIKLFVDFT